MFIKNKQEQLINYSPVQIDLIQKNVIVTGKRYQKGSLQKLNVIKHDNDGDNHLLYENYCRR